MESGITLYLFSTAIVASSTGYLKGEVYGWLTLGILWGFMGLAIAFVSYLDGE